MCMPDNDCTRIKIQLGILLFKTIPFERLHFKYISLKQWLKFLEFSKTYHRFSTALTKHKPTYNVLSCGWVGCSVHTRGWHNSPPGHPLVSVLLHQVLPDAVLFSQGHVVLPRRLALVDIEAVVTAANPRLLLAEAVGNEDSASTDCNGPQQSTNHYGNQWQSS